eukprot:6302681-Prymnesium_polylepis.1
MATAVVVQWGVCANLPGRKRQTIESAMIMLTDGNAVVRAASSTTLVVLDHLTAKDGRHAQGS